MSFDLDTAMRRALELAARGPAGDTNPQVGCVILSPDGTLLGEGWHRGSGTPHAEVDAMNRVTAEHGSSALHGSTAVVTLEPCNHTGRTGPCSVALIEAGVARVVYAVNDPGEHGSGGATRLRSAGVEVVDGVLAAEAEAFLEPWLTAVRRGSPWVSVKWASSLDGRVAAADGSSRWVTGTAARADVHRRRSEHGAILVGTGTLLADDPELTAREPGGALADRQPVPVVVGDRAVPGGARVREHPNPVVTIPGHDPREWMRVLGERGIRSVLVEGGPTVASAVIAAGLADRILVYLAPLLIGGPRTAIGDVGVASMEEAIPLEVLERLELGDDELVIARPGSRPGRKD